MENSKKKMNYTGKRLEFYASQEMIVTLLNAGKTKQIGKKTLWRPGGEYVTKMNVNLN